MALAVKLGATDKKKFVKPKLELTLDASENVPPTDMRRYSWLLYGNKGIGKTSLASRFAGAFFLALEPGVKGLRVRSKPVPDWDHFIGYVDLLVKANDPEMTVVVDTVDLVYDYIYDSECKRMGINSPKDNDDWGATWRDIRKQFRRQVERLLALPGGVVFISHDTEKEVTLVTAEGNMTTDRVQPTIAKQGLMEIEGLVDIAGYYGYSGNDRFLWVQGSQTRVAKCRPEEHFIVKGTQGQRLPQKIERVPMGSTSLEAFSNLQKAFNNLQETSDGVVKKTTTAPNKLRITNIAKKGE
jgi:hypothetical protein